MAQIGQLTVSIAEHFIKRFFGYVVLKKAVKCFSNFLVIYLQLVLRAFIENLKKHH